MSDDADVRPKEEGKDGKRPVKRVLLVEDEHAIAVGISMLLELEGIAVQVVARGTEAVPAMLSFRPDTVILDVTLPDMGGAAVYRAIAAADPSVRVLFSSGHDDDSTIAPFFAPGRVAFLRKPYDFDQLMTALGELT
jgi:two-component system response regulator AtoC